MKPILAVSALCAALSLSAVVPAAAAETYTIDGNHTFATFEYNHLGFSTASGRFNRTSGSIVLDRAKKTGSVEVTIQVDSVNTGVPKLDEHLKARDFFDAEKYPTIVFKSDRFTFEGERLTQVAGDLTVHGVTKPVVLKVTSFVCKEHPVRKIPACGADAVAAIKRSDFGMGAAAPAVSDEVTLRIEVEAHGG